MAEAYIVNGVRTPIGRYGGGLAPVRADDLAAHALRELMKKNAQVPASAIEDVILGCANQAGEDNRNVARMALLLAGIPDSVPGLTVNRLCGSGLDAVGEASRAIKSGEAEMMIAGGVESMSRAPFVMGKATEAYSRTQNEMHDTTLGWRFVNPAMKKQYGVDQMWETAENVAQDFQISRADQDKFAYTSQMRAAKAQKAGRYAKEIVPVAIPQRKGDPVVISQDEHLRAATLEGLAKLSALRKDGGTVTAGNASGVNDGAAALLIASEAAVKKYNLTPLARVLGMACTGVPPRIMGIGPAPASKKLAERLGLSMSDFDVIELNEAFASQGIAVLRQLGVPEDAEHVNPNGGAIALGHPLGMSGARIALSAAMELHERQVKRALCTMCIGVGQGIALAMERV